MSGAPVILGFDTATPDTAVATWADGESVTRTAAPAGGRPVHNTELLTLVEEVVEASGGWEGVGLIAVGIGPGSFTGLRIGIATARALAQSRGLPIAGVASTSALLAGIAASPEAEGRASLAVIDARRGEVFAALAAPTETGGADISRQKAVISATGPEPVVCAPGEMAARLGPEALANAVAAGDGAVRFRSEIEASGALVLPDGDLAHRLSASWICELAAGVEPSGPEAIRPMYLRRPDAERWRERDGSN